MLDGNSQCIPSASKCSPHQYIDQHGECHPCHKYCYRCSGPGKTHCLSCNPRHLLLSESSSFFFFFFLVELVISLKAVCPGKLVRHLRCLLSPRDRVFVGTDGTCVDQCPTGYYEQESGQKCEPCHASCKSCVGKHNHECLTCKAHLFREGKECVETCQHR